MAVLILIVIGVQMVATETPEVLFLKVDSDSTVSSRAPSLPAVAVAVPFWSIRKRGSFRDTMARLSSGYNDCQSCGTRASPTLSFSPTDPRYVAFLLPFH